MQHLPEFPAAPLGNRVVVQLDANYQYEHIIMPRTLRERVVVGRVLAVGPGPQLEDGRHLPIDVTPGQRVVLREYRSEAFPFRTEQYPEPMVLLADFLDAVLLDDQVVPLNDRLLITVPKRFKQTTIYLPDQAPQSLLTAEVLAVGPGRPTVQGTRVPCGVEVGETLLLNHYHNIPLRWKSTEFMLVRPADVLGVLETEVAA